MEQNDLGSASSRPFPLSSTIIGEIGDTSPLAIPGQNNGTLQQPGFRDTIPEIADHLLHLSPSRGRAQPEPSIGKAGTARIGSLRW